MYMFGGVWLGCVLAAAGTATIAPLLSHVRPNQRRPPVIVPIEVACPTTTKMELTQTGGFKKRKRENVVQKMRRKAVSLAHKSGANLGMQIARVQSPAPTYGDIAVGTPGQNLRIIFDTGSTTFWLAGVTKPDDFGFFPMLSSTFRWLGGAVGVGNALVSYGTGTAAGPYAEDVVRLGAAQIDHQPFIVANAVDWEPKADGFQGIIGLGLGSPALPIKNASGGSQLLSPSRSPKPLLEMLVDSGTIDTQVFSVCLRKGSPEGPVPGEIHFGESCPGAAPPLFVPVVPRAHSAWEVELTQLLWEDKPVTEANSGTTCILDSGSFAVVLPMTLLASAADPPAVNAHLISRKPRSLSKGCTLDSLPRLTFVLGGQSFVLEPSDYGCNGLLVSDDGSFPPILGVSFLRKFQVLFDRQQRQIGISRPADS